MRAEAAKKQKDKLQGEQGSVQAQLSQQVPRNAGAGSGSTCAVPCFALFSSIKSSFGGEERAFHLVGREERGGAVYSHPRVPVFSFELSYLPAHPACSAHPRKPASLRSSFPPPPIFLFFPPPLPPPAVCRAWFRRNHRSIDLFTMDGARPLVFCPRLVALSVWSWRCVLHAGAGCCCAQRHDGEPVRPLRHL